MNKKAKIAVIITSIILVIIALTTSTYALFTSQQRAANKSTYTTGLLSVSATSKTNSISLSGELPKSDDEGISSTPYTFTITNNGNLDYKFDIKLMSTSDNPISSSYIKVKIDDGSVTTLSQLTNNIIKENVVLSAGQSIDVSIRVWLSITTPNTEIGKTFTSKIVTDGEAVYTSTSNDVTAAAIINNLYNPVITVTTNNITYNYDVSHNMMKDAAGNLRYYGANPNNYIYFNCNDYSNQSADTCEVWRIIGVFDGKLKIIRNESIASLSWDQDKNDDSTKTSYDNDWNTSTLQKLLNGSYYEGTGTVTYYSGETGASTTTIDMNNIGIKNNNTRNIISKSSWNLGGWNSYSVYSNFIYEKERGTVVYSGRSTTWEGNIALIYPSDYGYAADFSKCKDTDGTTDLNLNKYGTNVNDYQCRSNDWLFYDTAYQWVLTSTSSSANRAWFVRSDGYVYDSSTYNILAVRPTLYLNADTKISAVGDGTSANPYQIQII